MKFGWAAWIFITDVLVTAFDKSAFKDCEASSFCARFRSWKETDERPLLKVVEVNNLGLEHGETLTGLHIKIQSSAEETANYAINVTFIGSMDMLRLEIDDIHPETARKRYRVPDGDIITLEAPVKQPGGKQGDYALSREENRSSLSKPGGSRVEVTHYPLKIAVYNANGSLVQVINSKNFFAFERYRTRKADRVCPNGTVLDMSCHEGVDVSRLWEELSGRFPDEKPHGPSAVGIDVELVNAKAVFGLPEHTTSFNLPVFDEGPPGQNSEKGEEFRFYNADVFEYEIESKVALYGSIPFLMAAHEDKTVSGFLWLNPSETFVSLTRRWESRLNVESTWVSESGVMDMVIFLGPSPQDVMNQYYSLTGSPAFPPLFALGHHQSKWGYKTQEEVIEVSNQFDEHQIPLDVVWLDIQHTSGNRYMTWNPEYSDPETLTRSIAESGRKVVVIVDPHVKVDDHYTVYTRAKERNVLVRNAKNDAAFEGWCWPGNSVYLDVSRPAFRDFWKHTLSYSGFKGSSPNLWIWNDMNEPSVFNGPEMSLPRTVRFGDSGEIEHRDLHNLYGQYYHRATYEALLARETPAKRPFVLSRSFFAGSQRFGPIWTGDNKSEWSHLKASVSMLLSLAVSGMSFAGADVGGFFGHPGKELFIRWHQLGALAYPFYRSHAHLDSPRREPWMFDQETLDIVRNAIELRYSLMPYWYTAAARNTLEGLPMIRPLWFDHMADQETVSNPLATEEEMIVGDSILVRGIFEPGTVNTQVYLPGEETWWYEFHKPENSAVRGGSFVSSQVNLNTIPTYIKAGTILPLKLTKTTSTSSQKGDPITFQVWPDITGKASGFIFCDDGDTFGYRDNQDFALLRANYAHGKFSLTKISGSRSLDAELFAGVIIAGYSAQVRERGEPVSFNQILLSEKPLVVPMAELRSVSQETRLPFFHEFLLLIGIILTGLLIRRAAIYFSYLRRGQLTNLVKVAD